MATTKRGTSIPFRHLAAVPAVFILVGVLTACGRMPGSTAAVGSDSKVRTTGTVEVTARLVEVPDGAIFQRDLYDYAAILKYEVTAVHRGVLTAGVTICVGHYNPWKPRAEAADPRVPGVGGSLRRFRAGDVHRLALETPMEDHYFGGVVDKYFDREAGPRYWAVWVDAAK